MSENNVNTQPRMTAAAQAFRELWRKRALDAEATVARLERERDELRGLLREASERLRLWMDVEQGREPRPIAFSTTTAALRVRLDTQAEAREAK